MFDCFNNLANLSQKIIMSPTVQVSNFCQNTWILTHSIVRMIWRLTRFTHEKNQTLIYALHLANFKAVTAKLILDANTDDPIEHLCDVVVMGFQST